MVRLALRHFIVQLVFIDKNHNKDDVQPVTKEDIGLVCNWLHWGNLLIDNLMLVVNFYKSYI